MQYGYAQGWISQRPPVLVQQASVKTGQKGCRKGHSMAVLGYRSQKHCQYGYNTRVRESMGKLAWVQNVKDQAGKLVRVQHVRVTGKKGC